MSNALHGRWASRRSLVFPSRLVPQCHGWRRSSRHMCSLCSSCAPLAEGRHHTRWPSTTAQHRPAPPRRARPTRAAPIAGGEVELALPSAEGQGARGRPNARPELQPITGGGEELSGRTWVQAAPPHPRAPAPRGAQRSTSRRAPAPYHTPSSVGTRCRPNARPELQPITGGGEELSGRTWVQAALPHPRAPAPRGAQRSTLRRAPAPYHTPSSVGTRCRPNARPELQPITGGGEELSGRTWVQAAPQPSPSPSPNPSP